MLNIPAVVSTGPLTSLQFHGHAAGPTSFGRDITSVNSDDSGFSEWSKLDASLTAEQGTPIESSSVGSPQSVERGEKFPINTSYISPNFGERRNKATADMVIIHFTAASFRSAMNTFTNPKSQVSAHYLIPDTTDPTYKERDHDDMQIFQLVPVDKRAWHAGRGAWKGLEDVNSRSIGIEIVNQATDVHGNFTFPPYKSDQIQAALQLLRDIFVRYPHIRPENVIAHSDMTSRKSDPGPQFPWKELGENGLAAWYEAPQRAYLLERIEQNNLPTDRSTMIRAMKEYGYSVSEEMSNTEYKAMVRAFQMHFCPEECGYSGEMNNKTAATLYAVCCKYCPDALPQITNCIDWNDIPETTTTAISGASCNSGFLGPAIVLVSNVLSPLTDTFKWLNRLGVANTPPIDWAREV
jgi:N-acetylmuramoyl-L-alanine amidase